MESGKTQSLGDRTIGLGPFFDRKNHKIFWCPTDVKETWKKNMSNKTAVDYFSRFGWDKEDSIIYSHNSVGFRDNEFDSPRDIITLGCSYTYGVGLPEHMTWPRLIEGHFNKTVANLGIPGASIGSCFRLLYYWLDKLRPKLVVCLIPYANRLELIENIDDSFCWFHRYTVMKETPDDFLKRYWATDYNSLLDRERNLLSIQYLCEKAKVDLISVNVEDILTIENDYARDMEHPGPLYQKKNCRSDVRRNIKKRIF